MAIRDVRDVIGGLSLRKTTLPARWRKSSLAILGCLLIQTTANAIPIGDLSWNEYTQDDCDLFGQCGAFFSVGNFSTDPDMSLGALGDSFFNVSVDLSTLGGPLSLLLGDIAPGDSRQSSDPLADVTILSAALTLTFGNPVLPGSIELLDEAGNIVAALSAPGSVLIDFTAAPVASVPEPSTLLLLLGGALVLMYERRRRQNGRLAVIHPDRVHAA